MQAGKQVYSVRVTSSKGEAVTTADDISKVELIGLPELVLVADAFRRLLRQWPAGKTVLIKYARLGDANLDGTVGFADLLRLAQSSTSSRPRGMKVISTSTAPSPSPTC